MKTTSFSHIVICTMLCFFNLPWVEAQETLFSKEVYSNNQGDELSYRMLVPDYGPKRPFPLVIFLHGSGERGNDNESQLKWGVQNFASNESLKNFPAIVVAPQCPEDEQWANFRSGNRLQSKPSKPMGLLRELIDEVIKEHPIDTERIYITGLSMGGFGTFDALARYPDLFAAAVPVCGGGDLEKAGDIAHIPIWIFTGSEDTVVDSKLSRDMVNALTEAGATPGFTQYPEVGHFSWIAAYSNPMMMAWLFRQRKEDRN